MEKKQKKEKNYFEKIHMKSLFIFNMKNVSMTFTLFYVYVGV